MQGNRPINVAAYFVNDRVADKIMAESFLMRQLQTTRSLIMKLTGVALGEILERICQATLHRLIRLLGRHASFGFLSEAASGTDVALW